MRAIVIIALVGLVGLLGWVGLKTMSGREFAATITGAAARQPRFAVQDFGFAPDLSLSETYLEAVMQAGGRALTPRVTGRTAPPQGRAATLPAGTGFRHQWPGVYAAVRFGGDVLIVAFDDTVSRYRLTVDDGSGPALVITRPGKSALRLAGLGPGPHTARLDKISETLGGVGGVDGFFVPSDGEPLAPPDGKPRQIELIGDSDTVGYGNTSTTRDCSGDDVFRATDTQESFGPRVARHFDADYQITAMSGIGLVRNYDGVSPGVNMITKYPRILFDQDTPYAFADWAPQIVVVALGSNDFSSDVRSGEPWGDQTALASDFETRFVAFLEALRARNPDAYLLLAAVHEDNDGYLSAQHAVLTSMQARGETRVGLIELPKMEEGACHWHPSLRDHEVIADALIGYIRSQPGLWQD